MIGGVAGGKLKLEYAGLAATALLILFFIVAVQADARKLFTANYDTDSVAFVNVENGVATSSVSYTKLERYPYPGVIERPFDVAINPAGTRAYVINRGLSRDFDIDGDGRDEIFEEDNDYLYVINTEDGSLVTSVTISDKPIRVAVSPDGKKVFVTHTGTPGRTDPTLSIIDTTNYQVDSRLVGQADSLKGVAVHPDGTRVYAADPDGQRIWVLSTSTDSVVDVIDLSNDGTGGPSKPRHLAFTPDGDKLIVTYTSGINAPYDSHVLIIGSDPSKAMYHRVEGRIDLNARVYRSKIEVTPDGSRAYIPSYGINDQVDVVDIHRQTVLSDPIVAETTSIMNGPYYIAMSPSGAYAYIGNSSGIADFLSVVDTDSGSKTYNQLISPIYIPNEDAIGAGTRPLGVAIIPNKGPVAKLTVHASVAGAETWLDASRSSDLDGRVYKYHWVFGDGSSLTTSSPMVSHKYRSTGAYTATVTVEDNEGGNGNLIFTGRTAMHTASPAKATITFDVAPATIPGSRFSLPEPTIHRDIPKDNGAKKRKKIKLKINRPRKNKHYKQRRLRNFKGSAKGGKRIKVRYSLARLVIRRKRVNGRLKRIKRCKLLTAKGKRRKRKIHSCRARAYRRARGSKRWKVRLRRRLHSGRYILNVKATNAERSRAVKKVKFRVVR